jgi:integrase
MPVRAKDGKLFFDFLWRGVRCKEYTGLADTPDNRRRCEQKMLVVKRAILRKTFDYRQHFPRGSRLHLFFPENHTHEGAATTFAVYIASWHKRRSPFLPDGSVGIDTELHPSTWIHDESLIRRHFIPAFGPLRLDEIDVPRCREFRRALVDAGLSGKTISNVVGLLHKAFSDAVEEGLIERNPVLRASNRRLRLSRRQRLTADPLTPEDIRRFLAHVPAFFRELYSVWFQVGWRSSEIVALRFSWLDFTRQSVLLQRARIPRWGGVEAEPKTVWWTARMLPRSFGFLRKFAVALRAGTAIILSSPTMRVAPCRKSGSTSEFGSRHSDVPGFASAVNIASATPSSRCRFPPVKIPVGSPAFAAPRSR